MLEAEVVRAYSEQGCAVVPNFFSAADVEAMRREVERLRYYGWLNNAAFTKAGGGSMEAWGLDRYSALFRALPFHEKLSGSVGQLIASPFALQATACILKPAKTGRGTRWHADDYKTAFHPGDKAIGVWIAVHDVTPENGPLEILPGSSGHDYDYVPDTDIRTNRPMVRLSEEEQARAQRVLVRAGGIAFFSYNTLHRTCDNESANDRAAITVHFVSADQFAPDYPHDDYHHPYVTGPRAGGGLLNYGADQRGRWESEAARSRAWQPPPFDPNSVYSYVRPLTLTTASAIEDSVSTMTDASIMLPTGLVRPVARALDSWDVELVQGIDGNRSFAEIVEAIADEAPNGDANRANHELRMERLVQMLVEHGILAEARR